MAVNRVSRRSWSHRAQVLGAYAQLTKPRIGSLVLVACTLAFLLASGHPVARGLLGWTLLGSASLAAGACVLNQFLERETDACMERTRRRPLPAGILTPAEVLAFGVLLVLAGCVLVVWRVNLLTAFLGLLSAFLYVLVYTPMKRLTWLGTSLGAVPGAIPCLMGWTAATGRIAPGGWVLFVMVFLWQHVHFPAIAWIFREDYRRARVCTLAEFDPSGSALFRVVVVAATALLAASMGLDAAGLTGPLYRRVAPLAGAALLAMGWLLARRRSVRMARAVLLASVCYLPLLLGLVCLDRMQFAK